MKGLSVPDPEPPPEEEEEELIPELPDQLTIGNRNHKRAKGVRSNYKARLKELQKEFQEKESRSGD